MVQLLKGPMVRNWQPVAQPSSSGTPAVRCRKTSRKSPRHSGHHYWKRYHFNRSILVSIVQRRCTTAPITVGVHPDGTTVSSGPWDRGSRSDRVQHEPSGLAVSSPRRRGSAPTSAATSGSCPRGTSCRRESHRARVVRHDAGDDAAEEEPFLVEPFPRRRRGCSTSDWERPKQSVTRTHRARACDRHRVV